MGAGTWGADHRDALAGHVAAGRSYREAAVLINERFGTSFTRNSAISRGHRSGLKTKTKPGTTDAIRPKRNRPPKQPRPRPDVVIKAWAEKPPRLPRAEVDLRCAEVAPRLVSLIDLESGDCRYPFGDGPFQFCGHAKQEGSSYCAAHFHLTRNTHPRAARDALPQVRAAVSRSLAKRLNKTFRILARVSDREDVSP